MPDAKDDRNGSGKALGAQRSEDGSIVPTDAEREEIIEALLEPDRSHHDELGRTVDAPRFRGRSSPREQGAAPIDVTNIDE